MADDFRVPALEKGLDVLELLADEPGALSQTEIAERLGRSVGQLFRVLAALEGRGWIVRDRQSGLYAFSMRALELAHRHPPLRGLLAASLPAMRELAEAIRQSCNLAVLDAGRVRVVAQVESPADFGYRVRVGATFPVDSATGEALTSGATMTRPDPVRPAITDVVVPIGPGDAPLAALTVPYVATSFSTVPAGDVERAAAAAAAEITSRIHPVPSASSR